MDFTEIGCKGVDWIHLAQDMVQWQDTVNTVINFCFHKILELCLPEQLLALITNRIMNFGL
jgi:hypothetical protein